MSDTLADKLLNLFDTVSLDHIRFPDDIGVLDPFHGAHAADVSRVVEEFHKKFYADNEPRRLMLGINPGRLGAGSTGLAFTDTQRCNSELGIPIEGLSTYEPSSDFFYRMINAAGGPRDFYSRVYVHSVCPLGFTVRKKGGSEVNINYYDRKELQEPLMPFIVQWLNSLLELGFNREKAYCIGTGKNYKFLSALNRQHGFFKEIFPLEHPRYVMQYRRKSMEDYIDKYVDHVFGSDDR